MGKENRISFSKDGGAKHRDPANKHTPVAIFEQQHILPKLKRRTEKGSLRRLKPIRRESSTASSHATIDFSTNDYLGLAQSIRQQQAVEDAYARLPLRGLGSTGSRLLTGDSNYAQRLEARLAKWHRRPAALLCNSGYDANLSVLSCLSLNSRVLMDELCHNSIQMGLRLSSGYTLRTFRHSCLEDLERLLVEIENEEKVPRSALQPNTKPAVIVVESVYSMDGDAAPLGQILDLALRHNACVVVDEAHGLGVLGDRGLGLIEQLGLEHHPSLLCSVHTFGKAAGCHGAVVCGSRHLKSFLLNYGRPIVYSTSLPLHSLVSIACSYESMTSGIGDALRATVGDRVRLFRKLFAERILGTGTPQRGTASSSSSSSPLKIRLVASDSPIHALIVPGNTQCVEFCDRLYEKSNRSIRLYPIRSPTVPMGQERVRIILHSHNTEAQVVYLMELIRSTLCDIGILANTPETTTTTTTTTTTPRCPNGINHVTIASKL